MASAVTTRKISPQEGPLEVVRPQGPSEDFDAWLEHSKTNEYVREWKVSEKEISELRKQFKMVLAVLIIVAAASLWGIVWLRQHWAQSPLIAIAAGVLGSATAALRSAMSRYADGWENDYGIQSPDPLQRKERFSLRMSYSFLCRPVLGATAGLATYLGLSGGVWKVNNDAAIAFYCLLAGLFAKSLFDLLLDKFKQFFGVQDKPAKSGATDKGSEHPGKADKKEPSGHAESAGTSPT